LVFLKRQSDLKHPTTMHFKIIHTMIEVTFPSSIVFYMMYVYKMHSFIESPIVLVYFLFIILSVLHLDYRVSLFTGFYAALMYAAITYYGYNYVESSPLYTPHAEVPLPTWLPI
jgi:adenylate cyclase